MRKMKLAVEQLAVESFQTSAAHGRGTILGRMPEVEIIPNVGANPATYPECPSPLCVDTPLASCDGSCQPGCGGGGTQTVPIGG